MQELETERYFFINQKVRKVEWRVRWTPAQTSWVNSLFYWNSRWVSPNCPRNAYVSDAPFCGAHRSFDFRGKNGRATCLIIYGISQLELSRTYHEKAFLAFLFLHFIIILVLKTALGWIWLNDVNLKFVLFLWRKKKQYFAKNCQKKFGRLFYIEGIIIC